MAVKQKLAAMKKIEATGFTDPAKAAEYFKEKEIILEELTKSFEAVAAEQGQETEALKSTVKALREELKGQAASPKELSRRELCYGLGRGIAAAWAGNYKALADLSFTPNLKADNWTNPRSGGGYGGGVAIYRGSFIMSNGSITGNEARNYGSGVGICLSDASFVKTGGLIRAQNIGTTEFDGNDVRGVSAISPHPGHAVYYNPGNLGLYRDAADAGPGVNMDSSISGPTGGWEGP
jgi:hypothetical protein